MREEDKMMVHAYFNSMALMNNAWLQGDKEVDDMNFHLLQTPKRVRPYSKTRYVYKPSVVSQSVSLKPGDSVCVIGVTEGVDAGSTAVKVMRSNFLTAHTSDGWDGCQCSRLEVKQEGDELCECEKPIEEMTGEIKDNTFIVLLQDLGK